MRSQIWAIFLTFNLNFKDNFVEAFYYPSILHYLLGYKIILYCPGIGSIEVKKKVMVLRKLPQ